MSTLQKHVFSDELSAFREGYSTQYVLVNLMEKLKSALDRSKCGGALLMDLSKAFDCIPHDLMIAKLKAYGMSNQSLAFMCSYLCNRKQRVNVLGEKRDWLKLIKGVPQGSIMGPKIFNFFMNDFCWLFSEAILGNYADDNTLTAICESMDEVIRILGAEGRLALEWFEENQMKANPDKFQGILFGHTETETEISLGDTNIIKSSENVDLLGLIIDSKLNFSKHIQTTTQKASLKLIALRRLSKRLDPEVRLDYGQTFVLSKFSYCPLVHVTSVAIMMC